MWWLVSLALAGAFPIEADFDGDGKKEKLTAADDSLTLPGIADVIAASEGEVLDINPDKPGKELVVCENGPRDDRSCGIYTLSGGKWTASAMPEGLGVPAAFATRGNGFVMAWYIDRWYPRMEKLAFSAGKLTLVPQPFYSTTNERQTAGWTFTPDRIFPIVMAPGSSQVVANVAPKAEVAILLESVEKSREAGWEDNKRWFLVRTSSGLVGWVSMETMIGACDMLAGIASAG